MSRVYIRAFRHLIIKEFINNGSPLIYSDYLTSNVNILPWKDFLDNFWANKIIG
jgi:hypothetical protein